MSGNGGAESGSDRQALNETDGGRRGESLNRQLGDNSNPESAYRPRDRAEVMSSPVEETRHSSTYGSMVKSTLLLGGSTAMNLLIGMTRTKVTAVLLGPGGTGLMSLYSNATAMVGSVTNLNITYAGVRRIAEALGRGDRNEAARIAAVLQRTAWATGLLGVGMQLTLCIPLSIFAFGDASRAPSIAALSVVLLLQSLATSWQALLQAARKVSDVARQNVATAATSAVTGVALIAWLREGGIVPQLIAVSATGLVFAVWFGRRAGLPTRRPSWADMKEVAPTLLQVGGAITATGVLTTGTTYFVASLISRRLGLVEAGLYQAAWTLSGLFAGVVLNAMAADYYPRLAALGDSRAESVRLVNQQAEISLLLAMPGILGTLVLGKFVLNGLYSAKYLPAYDLMGWLLGAVAVRVLAWCMAYVLLARERILDFVASETVLNAVQASLSWLLIEKLGTRGVAIAIVVAYVAYGVILYWLLRRSIEFRISRDLARQMMWMAPSSLSVWLLATWYPEGWKSMPSYVATAAVSVLCLRQAGRKLDLGESIPEILRNGLRTVRSRLGRTTPGR